MDRRRTWLYAWFALAAAAVGLGSWGAWNDQAMNGMSPSWVQSVLAAFALFAVDFGNLDQPRDPASLAAATIALVVTTTGLLAAARSLTRSGYDSWRARWVRGHAVLVGYDARGQELLEQLLLDGFRVALIERDRARVEEARADHRSRRVLTILGDAHDPQVFRQANSARSKLVVVSPPDDLDILDAWLEFTQRHGPHHGGPAFFRMTRADYQSALRTSIAKRGSAFGKITCFDQHVSLVRRALWNEGPDRLSPLALDGERALNIAIVGSGTEAEILALELAHTAHYPGLIQPNLWIISDVSSPVDGDAPIHEFVRLSWHQAANWSRASHEVRRLDRQHTFDVIYAFLTDVEDIIRLRGLCRSDLPVVGLCGQDFSAAVEELFDGTLVRLPPPRPWQELEEVDRMARVIHESYARSHPEIDHGTWDELPHSLKEANRRAAMHVPIKMRALGFEICDRSACDSPLPDPSDEDVRRLAPMEHARWLAEKRLAGVVRGPRSTGSHPDLVTWQELSEENRRKDETMIRSLPLVVAAYLQTESSKRS